MNLNVIPDVHTSADYFTAIQNIPTLNKNEEFELADKVQNDGCIASAQKLVLHHLKFVAYIARNYEGYNLPLHDIAQEGNVGLMKAVKRFSPSVGVRLVSFAVHYIKAEIHEYVISNCRLLKMATTKSQRKAFFNLRKMRNSSSSFLSNTEAQDIAEKLDIHVNDVFEMEKRFGSNNISVTTTDSVTEDDDGSLSSGTNIVLSGNDKTEDNFFSAVTEESQKTLIYKAIKTLNCREQEVLRSRWLVDREDKRNLNELADEFGVSAERVRQIEKNALKKLKTHILEQGQ
jgi:RNA polymerase sigma-32 factor